MMDAITAMKRTCMQAWLHRMEQRLEVFTDEVPGHEFTQLNARRRQGRIDRLKARLEDITGE